jgi:hypothetical protein
VAIASTKIPELGNPQQGFWFMVLDARTDFAMFWSLVLLLAAGSGLHTLQPHRAPRPDPAWRAETSKP